MAYGLGLRQELGYRGTVLGVCKLSVQGLDLSFGV